VNFYNVAKPSKQHKAAQGYLKIQLADNTGVLTVRLWYANTIYKFRLGQLVTLWTVHVSNSSEHNNLAPSAAPLFTSIFPEGERNCHFMVHEKSDDGTQFRRPFNCKDSRVLPGLMTLKSFTDGGYDVDEVKLLVCVKSIGARKKCASYLPSSLIHLSHPTDAEADLNRNSTTSELISLGIFDDTADASLTLYGGLCDSASVFQPSKTVLLLSNPGWRIEKTAKLSLNANSRIDIDPALGDARRLRALAQRLTKKDHVNPPFPDMDVSSFETAPVRALFTLADVDDFARANPRENLVGYLSVVLTELHLLTPFKRNMLMSNECCGIPVFANKIERRCKQCDKIVPLRINPRIVSRRSLPRMPIVQLMDVSVARSRHRRDGPDWQWQADPLGPGVGAIAGQDGGATCRDGPGRAEVS
jgi:hypothetical protein